MVNAHKSAVIALSFSPDDKVLASYSFGDSKICLWQVSKQAAQFLYDTLLKMNLYLFPDWFRAVWNAEQWSKVRENLQDT